MTASLLLTNARIVLSDRIFHGWLEIADGVIASFGEGNTTRSGLDCGGDLVMPGLVELHTDHLEAHFMPRPKVRWPMTAAVLAYDAQIACSGITTVFDSLRLGGDDVGNIAQDALALAGSVAEAAAAGQLRADHRTHLRCEVATTDVVEMVERFTAERPAHLISLMDHTPGQRQFRDLAKARGYFARLGVASDAEWQRLFDSRQELHARFAGPNRRALLSIARQRRIVVASHDDATAAEVEEAAGDGVAIAEFPTTVEAAAQSHTAGIAVLMGAPNVVRGGSHSGNVAAEVLARAGTLDILSSDYVPNSLLLAALQLPGTVEGIDLPAAIRLVTRNPAEAVGLHDRGEIAAGKRADLLLVRESAGAPSLRSVWREGVRVA